MFLFVLVSLCTSYVVSPVHNNIPQICPLLSFSIAWSKPLTSLQDDSCLVSLLPLRLSPITPPHPATRIILLGHRNDVALNLLLNVSLFSPSPYLAQQSRSCLVPTCPLVHPHAILPFAHHTPQQFTSWWYLSHSAFNKHLHD